MPDFSTLLSKPVDQIEPPKPLPVGTYYGTLGPHNFDESAKKKTPYVRWIVNINEAGEDVDKDLLVDAKGQPINLASGVKKSRTDFYLSEDAQYRLKDFLKSLGIDDGGGTRTLGEMIPEAVNRPVMFHLTQQQSEDGKNVYNNIDDISARPE